VKIENKATEYALTQASQSFYFIFSWQSGIKDCLGNRNSVFFLLPPSQLVREKLPNYILVFTMNLNGVDYSSTRYLRLCSSDSPLRFLLWEVHPTQSLKENPTKSPKKRHIWEGETLIRPKFEGKSHQITQKKDIFGKVRPWYAQPYRMQKGNLITEFKPSTLRSQPIEIDYKAEAILWN